MFENTKNQLDVSWQSIWRFFIIFLLLLAIWFFRQIILFVLVAFIIASLLEEPINYLSSKIKNRLLATFIIYLISLFLIGLLVYLAIPLVSETIINLIPKFNLNINPEIIRDFIQGWKITETPFKNFFSSLSPLSNQLLDFFTNSISFLVKITGGAFSIFFIFLLAFFLNTERNGIERGIRLIAPKNYEEYIIYLWGKARKKVGGWFYSQLILSLLVGILAFIAFKILALPNSEFLAILTALLDFIPYIGPFIAGFIVTAFGFGQSLLLGVLSLVIFIAIQVLETIIAPSVRSRVMQINPLIVVFAILVGGKLAGALGIVIALPLAATIVEFIRDIRSGKINSYLPQKKLL
jgi:predicted PurR-regulated permease PerM